MHRRRVRTLLASDVSTEAVKIAQANLHLLTDGGLRDRAAELTDRAARFGKPGYAEAAEAAGRLADRLAADGGPVPHAVRRADVFDRAELAAAIAGHEPDVVITDPPYSEQTMWQRDREGEGLPEMLSSLAAVLPPRTVVAVTVRGRKVPAGAGVRPRESLRVGTRAVALFVAADLTGA
jgi:hypothetical protein